MRFIRLPSIASALLLVSSLPCAATPRVHRGPTAQHTFKERTSKPKVTPARTAIAPERATQIQTALINSGYLSGAPSGIWDDQTKAAMQKLQADNGWQTKLIPDSRAIIKLGLGPNSVASSGPEATLNESKQ